MSIFRRFRRAVRASIDTLGAQVYSVRGKPIVCPVCDGREFVRSSGGAYTKPMLVGFNLPWLKLDSQATSLICTHCTHMLTFGKAPELAEDELL